MATPIHEPHAGRLQGSAAWVSSFAVHAAVLLLMAYVSWTTLGGMPSQQFDHDPTIVVGLSDDLDGDEAGDSAEGDATASSSPDAADLAVDLPGESAMLPLPAVEGATESLAPSPRLPLLALGSPGRGASSASASPSVSNSPSRRSPRIGQVIEPTTVTVFGAVGEGSKFVYLFDRSTSMMGAPLAAAKRQLLASLADLDRVHQFHVIFFNHEVAAWDLTGGQQRIPFASESNKRLAEQFVLRVNAFGGTERIAPLQRALAFCPDVVFFLTDADDAMPEYDVADAIARAQRDGVAIACIEFGDGPRPADENFLVQLAQETGGDYVYVDTADLGQH